jgi:hypothetical protein
MVYLLSSLLEAPTPATPSGATNARLWTYNPSDSEPETIKTYTLEMGTAQHAEQLAGVRLRSLDLAWEQGGAATVGGGFLGRRLEEGATLSGGLTTIAARAVNSRNVSVFVGDALGTDHVYTITLSGSPTSGAFRLKVNGQETGDIAFDAAATAVEAALELLSTIGTGNVAVTGSAGGPYTATLAGLLQDIQGPTITATDTFDAGSVAVVNQTPGGLTRMLSCDRAALAIPDVFNPWPTLDESQPSYSHSVDIGFEPTAEIRVMHDTQGSDLMENFRDGETRIIVITASGGQIEAGFFDFMRFAFAARITGSDRADQDGVWASTYPLGVITDPDFGGYMKIEIQNGLAGL